MDREGSADKYLASDIFFVYIDSTHSERWSVLERAPVISFSGSTQYDKCLIVRPGCLCRFLALHAWNTIPMRNSVEEEIPVICIILAYVADIESLFAATSHSQLIHWLLYISLKQSNQRLVQP